MIDKKLVDVWGFESRLYAKIDATSMKGGRILNEKFNLGNKQNVSVKITVLKNEPISNHLKIKKSEVDFSVNFWKDSKPWFRIDNMAHDYLHFHVHNMQKRYQIPENFTIAELISMSFEIGKRIMKNFFEERIEDSNGFVGIA
jgi:hypothetical protein